MITAITELQVKLETCRNNAEVAAKEGNTAEAQRLEDAAKDIEEALDVLRDGLSAAGKSLLGRLKAWLYGLLAKALKPPALWYVAGAAVVLLVVLLKMIF